ncbi:hypothetical protein C2R22_09530 [Salinigranum rubrum]|uniref:PGF-pre-PGF domain-containing protein n=1 Tax=Salinigranum rubrum TaxID=755307 RepID=A0A2I8VLA0_9EURY|nr:PGF-pre-PGF domain-containing protein [Salinigranum rubrum]AUV81859.1 hypothetical protein C2R22_09530 [Salinigranum rubrum]
MVVAFAPAATMMTVGAHASASGDVSAETTSLAVDQSVVESVGVQPAGDSGLRDQGEESDDEDSDRGDGKSNGNGNGNSGSNEDDSSNSDSDGGSDSDSDGGSDSDSDGGSDSDSDGGSDSDSDGGSDSESDEGSDSESDGNDGSESDGNDGSESDGNDGSESDGSSNSNSNGNDGSESNGNGSSNSNSDAKNESEDEDTESKGKAKGKNENTENKGKDEGKAKGKDEEKDENGNEGKARGKGGDVVVTTHGTVISRTAGNASGSNGKAAPSVDFTVSNVTTGRPISLVLSEPTTGNASGTDGEDAASNQSMSVDRLDVTVTNDSDFTMNVTTATDPLDTTPAFEGVNGTESLAHLRVNHSVSDADIENVSFTFRLSQERLAEMETAPENVALYRYHDGEWTELPTEVLNVTAEGVVFEALSPGLSEFAAGAKRPKFKLDGATVSVEKITEGDTIDVYVTVSNLGSASGRFHADLILDDIIVDSQEVSVAAGGERRFTFERALDMAGTYEVRVNGLVAGEVTVENVEAESNREAYADETTQRSTSTPGSLTALDTVRAGGVPLSAAGVAFVAVLIVSLLAVARRRTD